MKKIQISNWAKGQDLTEKTKFMLDNFVKCIKRYSTEIIIEAYFDSITAEQVSPYVKDNVSIIMINDYADKQPHEWSLVKMLIISTIPDEEVLHLDYDIVLKSDVNVLIDIIRNSGLDAVYQSIEGVALHNYYSVFVKNNPTVFNGLNKRCAYNAGVTYFKDKSVRESFADLLNFYSDGFGEYISREQLAIPAKIQQGGFKVGVLANLLHKFKPIDTTYIDNQLISKSSFLKMSIAGFFMPSIGFYHFPGPEIKASENLIDGMKLIAGIYNE